MIGADVARELGYDIGSPLVLSHGLGKADFGSGHENRPFRVVGILAPTGTPVDRTLHISLAGMEALHVDWQNGMPARGDARVSADQARAMDLQPRQITAFMLGLNSKIATFSLQREINEFRGEPMLAILPGVALQELWSLMGTAEQALFVVSLFVVLTGLIGMLTAILTSLNERRREMAILRSVGARPWHIASLLVLEAFQDTYLHPFDKGNAAHVAMLRALWDACMLATHRQRGGSAVVVDRVPPAGPSRGSM